MIKHTLPGITDLQIIPRQEGTINLEITRHYNALEIKRSITRLLRGFGVDTNDPNFTDTPRRVEKMWSEWLTPKSLKLTVFPSDSKGAVTLIGHEAVSMCPHHLLPFSIKADLAYIPQGYVVGLSKLARLVDLVCSSFVLQEHISDFVVKVLSALLLPKGVMCRVRSIHGCMRLRGVRTTGIVSTTALDGVYLTDEKARNEFMKEAENGSPAVL